MTYRWFMAAWLLWSAAGLSLAQTGPYSIRLVAGRDAGGDSGLAVNALVPFPSKVAADKAGNVYVSQIGGPIRRIAANGVITTIATATTPYALVADGANNLYIAQNGTCTIVRLNLQSGVSTTVAGNGVCRAGQDGAATSTSLFVPFAVVIDPQGNLLVADYYSYRVRRIDLAKATVTTIAGDGTNGTKGEGGPATQAEIGYPADLAVDSKGDIFIADGCIVHEIDASTSNLRTIAGTGTCAFSGDGGPPRSAQLYNPRSLAVSPAGNLVYVGEQGSARIRQINLDTNKITTYAGTGTAGVGGDGGPATSAQLAWPWGLSLDDGGNLLVADYVGSRVRKIDSFGIMSTFAGAPSEGGDGGPAAAAVLNGPGSTAPDGKGGIFVMDDGNRRIRQVSPPGVISTIAGSDIFSGTTGDGGLAINAGLSASPAMTTDPAGNIYFTDAPNGEVRRISGGIISRIGPSTFNFAFGVGVDATRQVVYATELSGARIIRLDLAIGNPSTFAGLGTIGANGTAGNDGDGPALQHKLNAPGLLAVDGSGNVYVSDAGNYLIRRISPSTGLMATVAGNGQNTSSGDGGKATSAGVANVSGLAADASGNIFIAEGTRIRRVDALTGGIATIAGTPTGGGSPLVAQLSGVEGLSVDAQGSVYFTAQGSRVWGLSPSISGPSISAVIVASSFGGGLNAASGTWIEIYGDKLAAGSRQWALSDFNGIQAPTSLDGVRVLVGGQPAFLDFISQGQVNAQLPDGIGTGNVTVQVVNSSGTSAPVVISVAPRAPAMFAPASFTAGGTLYAGALYADGTFVGPAGLVAGLTFHPAKAGDHIVLYGIGFGATSPVIPPGTITTQATTFPNVSVRLGSANAAVEAAGQTGGSVGLDQLNIVVPAGLSGDVLLSVSVNGVPMTQTLFLALQ